MGSESGSRGKPLLPTTSPRSLRPDDWNYAGLRSSHRPGRSFPRSGDVVRALADGWRCRSLVVVHFDFGMNVARRDRHRLSTLGPFGPDGSRTPPHRPPPLSSGPGQIEASSHSAGDGVRAGARSGAVARSLRDRQSRVRERRP